MLNGENQKSDLEDEVDDTLNSLFKSTINVDLLKSPIKKSSNAMTSSDFSLEKELAQTKLNININEINDENKYLKKRHWDSLDDNKILFLEQKAEEIFKVLDKKRVDNLKQQINKCNLDNFYKNFRPKCNDKAIGSISSLDFLVETTFNCSPNHYDIMIEDREKLNSYIYKFRSVLGDGDCFYRGFIFSFLENIILTNNIMLMKELLILFHEKINPKNDLIKDKDYLLILHQMNFEIVTSILYILINQMESDIEKAYKSLLKVFLYCPDFDFGIIYFTRYLIYEFITANEDKIYSREFQLEIGCLLPEDYIIDKGDKNDYLFEDYFSLQLMQTKTFAEKIVLYIAPFVFNTNMNILIYDFGINGASSSIQEKLFLSDNDTSSQIQINLIFRKSHYDIYYKINYYEEFKSYFNILKNIKEDIQVINGNFLKQKEEDDKNLHDKIEQNIDNNKNLPICLECKKQSYKLNEFFCLCDNCLLNNLKTSLLTAYMGFIQEKSNMIKGKEKLNYLLRKTVFNSEVQGMVPIQTALNNTEFKFEDIFLDVRIKLCIYCGENLKSKDDYFIKFPCDCRICSQSCFFNYVEILKQILNLYEKTEPFVYVKYINYLECFCGYFYHTNDVLYMINELEKRKLEEQKKVYQDYIKYVWIWKCMICLSPFKSKYMYYRVFLDTDEIGKKIDTKLLKSKKDLKHLLCGSCRQKLNKDEKIIPCKICEFDHKVKNIVDVDEFNEEDSCSVF